MKQTISAMFKLKCFTPYATPSLSVWVLFILSFSLQALLLGQAQAAGLGKMRVISALGAPFSAEVDVTNVRPDEEGNMVVRIAPPEVFKQAGIDYNPALPSIRATLIGDANNQKIVLNSASSINEPLLEMLVELSWQSGRLVRQYTVLLDPAIPLTDTPANPAPIQAASPLVASAANANSPPPVAVIDTPPVPVPSSAVANSAGGFSKSTADKTYDVKKGDTLSAIASRLSGGESYSSSRVRSLMAIFLQNNPNAFINNNMNRLKAGVVLNTDSYGMTDNIAKKSDSMMSSSGTSREFSQYKQAATKSVRPILDKNAKTIKNTVKNEVAIKAPTTSDQLKVSGNAAIGNQSAANASKTQEAQIAKDRAVAEEKSRIAELEKNIKKSVDIKNSILTTPQATTPKPESSKLGAPNAAAVSQSAANTAIAASGANNPSPAAAAAPTTTASSVPAAVPAVSPPLTTNTPSASGTIPSIAEVKKPASPTVEEPSWYENIDPTTLGGVAGVLALLGAWSIYRRKKNQQDNAFVDTSFNTKDTQASLLTAQGGQAVDTFNSVFVSNFSDANMSLESVEVDPVAEADVYMQYGRDSHAEDILLDALKQNPARHPVRLKLMELYASKGNQSGLNTQFDTLSTLTKSTGSEWSAAKKIVDASKNTQVNVDANSGLVTPTGKPETSSAPKIAKPFNSNGLAIGNISLSAPTMIGDLSSTDASSVSNGNFASGRNISGLKSDDASPAQTGLYFDVQNATTIQSPSATTTGLVPPLTTNKPSANIDLDAMLEFKTSKPEIKPEFKVAPQFESKASLVTDTNTDKLAVQTNSTMSSALETKLSLAKAYTDIGDKEGARELLQEVIEAGHQSLSAQAKTLLTKL
jgi:pilus assembly protein FimV